jgi:hypothetical protein
MRTELCAHRRARQPASPELFSSQSSSPSMSSRARNIPRFLAMFEIKP